MCGMVRGCEHTAWCEHTTPQSPSLLTRDTEHNTKSQAPGGRAGALEATDHHGALRSAIAVCAKFTVAGAM